MCVSILITRSPCHLVVIGLSIEPELKRLEGGDIETIGIKWATGIAHQNKKLSRTDPFIKKKNKEIEDLDDVFIFLFFLFLGFWGFCWEKQK